MSDARAIGSRRSVAVGLLVALLQTAALGAASVATGSAAMKTQTAASVADIVVGASLLIGVVSGNRPADDRHPLGYGRERFFWSFIAAVVIFIGGAGAAVAETVQTALHPRPAGSYIVGYAVLSVVLVLDAVALAAGLRPLRRRAVSSRVPVMQLLWSGSDTSTSAIVLGSAGGVLGGVIAAMGLAGRQLTGSQALDVLASALIGLVLLATSILLLHNNRELLTGRGISSERTAQLRAVVTTQLGVVEVPDIFATVVGPATVIVNADVVFDDALDVPQLERVIVQVASALRAASPSVAYVYLNPVQAQRPRLATRAPVPARRG